MIELTSTNDNCGTIHWKLLTGVSTLALIANVASPLKAEEADHAQVWIELGGQLEQQSGQPSLFAPSFFALATPTSVHTMTDPQRSPRWAVGGEGKIKLTPEGTNWVFSAAVRYGRSNKSRHSQYQAAFPTVEKYFLPYLPPTNFTLNRALFSDAKMRSEKNHVVLDFMAGKDVGLGMFGTTGTSVVSAGVRFAQFVTKTDTSLYARPVADLYQVTVPGKYKIIHPHYQTYTAVLHAERSTHAIGPSLSWEASMPIAGNEVHSELTVDWGVNGAVLFGRQRANIRHQTTSYDYRLIFGSSFTAHRSTHTAIRKEGRTAVIPNLGGFGGVSLKFPNAKVSLGYRADFFFNAIDNGIDTRHLANQGFYGPFATISIGLP